MSSNRRRTESQQEVVTEYRNLCISTSTSEGKSRTRSWVDAAGFFVSEGESSTHSEVHGFSGLQKPPVPRKRREKKE
jgi:hypothetical protein